MKKDKRWEDFNFAHDGEFSRTAYFCKECDDVCTCHICMHELSEMLDLIEPPRYPNLLKIIEETQFKELLKKK